MLVALLLQTATSALDRIVEDPALKSAVVGACVMDSGGKLLYEHDANFRMIPASNQKLITAAYALKILGPDYQPQTKFWRTRGAVTIDATGDPLLSHDDLVRIREELKIDRRTRVFVHGAYGPLYPPGWEWDDLRNKYAAPVSAFSVDRSSFELWTEGKRLFYLPESYGAEAEYLGGEGPLTIDYDPRSMVARVSGTLPAERTRLDTLALGQPDLAAAMVLGKRPKRVPRIPSDPPTYVHTGAALSEILKQDLPSSDNNISENLLLMASAVSDKDRDPYQVANLKEAAFLESEIGLAPDQFKVADGSGLSRHNVVTPEGLARLLVWADTQPTRDLWHACLARPGEEGTLKSRLEGVPFEGKTGTMDMVSALSGYLRLQDGRELAVVILVNDFAGSTAQTRDLQDAFIKKVLESGNEGTLFAESEKHEVPRPNPRAAVASHDRLRRFGGNRRAAPARDDSRDEPDHAGLH